MLGLGPLLLGLEPQQPQRWLRACVVLQFHGVAIPFSRYVVQWVENFLVEGYNHLCYLLFSAEAVDYVGCFKDDPTNSALPCVTLQSGTVEACQKFC